MSLTSPHLKDLQGLLPSLANIPVPGKNRHSIWDAAEEVPVPPCGYSVSSLGADLLVC